MSVLNSIYPPLFKIDYIAYLSFAAAGRLVHYLAVQIKRGRAAAVKVVRGLAAERGAGRRQLVKIHAAHGVPAAYAVRHALCVHHDYHIMQLVYLSYDRSRLSRPVLAAQVRGIELAVGERSVIFHERGTEAPRLPRAAVDERLAVFFIVFAGYEISVLVDVTQIPVVRSFVSVNENVMSLFFFREDPSFLTFTLTTPFCECTLLFLLIIISLNYLIIHRVGVPLGP